MKYEFKKIDEDTTELKYKDKKFEIKRDIDLVSKLQSLSVRARTKMMVDLTKQGISKKDLVIEKKEGTKTYYDNSNLIELENEYYQQATLELMDELCRKYFNSNLASLLQDIELEEDETEEFGKELMLSFSGMNKFPREETKDIL